MPEVVLDASALLAVLNGEPGADLVVQVLPRSTISTVNLCEVVSKLSTADMPPKDIREAIEGLPLEITPFDGEQAYSSGLLSARTQRAGLSLGDRACLNLGKTLSLPVITADKAWAKLSTGVKVKLIR